MTTTEKQNLITAARDAISGVVKHVRTLQTLNACAVANGGLSSLLTNDDFTGEHAGITAATFINFMTGNVPTLETGLFTGNTGANATNTYGLVKLALL